MRNRLREINAGRSALAWRRATARGTIWLREFASASSWPAAIASLDVASWNASPFGERLAELTGGEIRFPSAPALRRLAAPGASQDMPRGSGRGARDDAPTPAQRPLMRRHVKTGPANGRPTRHTAAAPPAEMTHAQLTALAGHLPRALRSASTRSRIAERPRPRGAPYAGAKRACMTLDAAASNAVLAQRMTARLDRVFKHTFGSQQSTAQSRGKFAGAGAWGATVAPPESDLVLAGTEPSRPVGRVSATDPVAQPFRRDIDPPSAAPSGVASPVRSQSTANEALKSWRRPIAAPETALDLSIPMAPAAVITHPTRHETRARPRDAARFEAPAARQRPAAWPANAPAMHSEIRPAAPSATTTMSAQDQRVARAAPDIAQADMRAAPPQPFAVAPRHPRSPRTTADQFELTELLRLALIEDARRYGIDV